MGYRTAFYLEQIPALLVIKMITMMVVAMTTTAAMKVMGLMTPIQGSP